MAKIPLISQINFKGGMDVLTPSLLLRDDESTIVQNYHLDRTGALTKRNGLTYLIGQVVDNKSILNMYFFTDKQGTDYSNVLVACNDSSATNSDIFKIASNAWSKSKEDDTASSIPVFTTFIDYVFRTNGTEAMASSADLTTWGTTNCLATLVPKYCCVWEDRVYALNDNSTTKYPSRIWWSDLPSGTPLAVTWGASNYADINPDDNDEITWGEPFGSQLLIFKNNGLYRWIFGQTEPDKVIDVGTHQGLTVKKTQGFLFFANKDGVWTYADGARPKYISKKVQPFIDAISTADLTNMRAETDRDHYYLYIGTVIVDGETYSNVVLVYTISLESWHIETYPFVIKAMARLQTKTLGTTAVYDSIYLGDNDGFVYRKGVGTYDYNGTTITPINGLVRTKEFMVNLPFTSNLKHLYVIASQAVGTNINYRLDKKGRWIPAGSLTERFNEMKLAGRCSTVQIEFTDNSRATSQIEGLLFLYNPEQSIR